MSIFSDAKADQFVYDENYDYINNKEKKTIVEPIVAYKVHETFEVASDRNTYGPFNSLVNKLMDAIKKQVKLDQFDETKYNEDTYKNLFVDFQDAALEMIKEKFDNFGYGEASKVEATKEDFIVYPNNPNYSGGPIAGKNYDIIEKATEGTEGSGEPLEPEG